MLRGRFRLASGGESGLFFDMKLTLLLPEGRHDPARCRTAG